jgi:hypothetical protein
MIDPGSPASVKVKACDLGLQHAAAASEDDIAAWLSEYKRERQAIPSFLAGDRRTFEEIEREPPKVAA